MVVQTKSILFRKLVFRYQIIFSSHVFYTHIFEKTKLLQNNILSQTFKKNLATTLDICLYYGAIFDNIIAYHYIVTRLISIIICCPISFCCLSSLECWLKNGAIDTALLLFISPTWFRRYIPGVFEYTWLTITEFQFF